MDKRTFLKTSALAGLAAATLPKFSFGAGLGGDRVKVAFVGCGGRATGAIQNMTDADDNIQIVGIAELFPSQVEKFAKNTKKYVEKKFKDKAETFWKNYWKVTPENTFFGLDAIDKLLASTDAQVIAIATTPCFRTSQIEKCLNAGKHVFAEKPICIDAVQYRKVVEELAPLAEKKGLKVLCGTQMRYHKWIAEAVDKIRSGDIGDILSTNCFRYEPTYLTRASIDIPTNDMPVDDVKYQLINWLAFIWTSGDQVVEQYVHNLDIALWALGELPYELIGSGGRSTNLKFPQQGDRFSNVHGYLTFKNGSTMNASCRQEPSTTPFAPLHIYGTKGMASLGFGKQNFFDTKGKLVWQSSGDRLPELICEHKALFDAIRNGKPFNTLKTCAESCCVGIAIRETSYAGRRIKYDLFKKKSQQSLLPEKLFFDGKKNVAAVPNPVDYKLLK